MPWIKLDMNSVRQLNEGFTSLIRSCEQCSERGEGAGFCKNSPAPVVNAFITICYGASLLPKTCSMSSSLKHLSCSSGFMASSSIFRFEYLSESTSR